MSVVCVSIVDSGFWSALPVNAGLRLPNYFKYYCLVWMCFMLLFM
jgi:hypothetical protein